ncbi:hypothetical protein WJX73_005850 [Symbiochloris irregularis]|uniref:AMP-dependent synthetase/ligase domain-containing protein n=1 Tax=Symbiochloris irregularis TaxID=706552 RepID=A0AAW1NXJ0_9CHLO
MPRSDHHDLRLVWLVWLPTRSQPVRQEQLPYASLLAALGGPRVFLPDFSPEACATAISQHEVTTFIAVPTILSQIVSSARESDLVLPSIRTILLGAGPAPVGLEQSLPEVFPCTRVVTAYGMTEACSSITFHTFPCPVAKASTGEQGTCVGTAPPGIEVCIRPLTAGNRDLQGSAQGVGEVMTRGPHIMLGYVGAEDAASSPLQADGWLATGDLGWMDAQQRLWLVGRLKDVIRSGSENVHAGEVERVLVQHPAVVAAAVVGLPHPHWGEQVSALLQLQPTACIQTGKVA